MAKLILGKVVGPEGKAATVEVNRLKLWRRAPLLWLKMSALQMKQS